MPDRLLIRADATTKSGTGHVMRCLALAQEWQHNSGEVISAHAEVTSAVERRLRTEGFELLRVNATPGSADDVNQTIRFARQHNATWVVADGYHFDAEYQHRIKEAGLRLLFLDDYGHAKHYWADYVLNQNLSADPKLYASREPYTQLLLGPRYVLLRKEFEKWRDWKRNIPVIASRVLITLGGSDPNNVTGKVIDALGKLTSEKLECMIVVGGNNPHLRKLQAQCNNAELKIDPTNMPELMAWADVAISAGGSTLWELAFMGLPNLVIAIADNQTGKAAALQSRGLSINLGFHTDLTKDQISTALSNLLSNVNQRRTASEGGRQLVDGLGVKRVCANLPDSHLKLRRAPEDERRRAVG